MAARDVVLAAVVGGDLVLADSARLAGDLSLTRRVVFVLKSLVLRLRVLSSKCSKFRVSNQNYCSIF